MSGLHINGLVQEIYNSIANALELHLSNTTHRYFDVLKYNHPYIYTNRMAWQCAETLVEIRGTTK